MKKYIAGAVTALLAAAGAVALSLPASAAEPGASPGDPIVVTSQKDAPAGTVWTPGVTDPATCMVTDTGVLSTPGSEETTHEEYRFRTRAELHGSKEVKEVTGYDFVDGGRTQVDGKMVAGHWVKSDGTHVIPDVIINIVWGPGGVPESVLGQGTVNLSVYGGPRVNVHYDAHKVVTDEGYTDWGPWSDWSTDKPTGTEDTMQTETRTVGNGDGAEASMSYYSYTHRDGACLNATAALETSFTQQCGSVTVTLHNVSPWIYPVTFVVDDGDAQYGATVDNRTDGKLSGPVKDATNSKTFTFAEDSGVHTVKYRVDAGSENSLYKGLPVGEWTTVTVQSDCEPNVPAQPEALTGTDEGSDAPVCVDDNSGTSTTTSWTQDWTQPYVLNDDGTDWVLGEKVYDEKAFTTSEPAADEDCVVIPPEPKPQEPTVTVEQSDWTGPTPTCDNPEVVQTRTTTTTTVEYTPTLQENTWVQVAGEPVVATTEESRTLTYEGDDCEAIVPPTEPTEPTTPVEPTEPTPPVVPTEPTVPATPSVTPSPTHHAVTPTATPKHAEKKATVEEVVTADDLAETGGSLNPIVPIGGALALALGALAIVLGVRYRTR